MANIDVKALKDSIDPRSYYEQHVRFTSRHGDWWEGHCPFHEDKNPSFGANIRTGQWKCHSCGNGGDVIEFEMQLKGCDFKQALANLGGGNVVPLRPAGSRPAPAKAEEKKEVPKTIDPAVAERYHQLLLTDTRAKTALEFLHKVRGYTDETIKKYQLGFDPDYQDGPRITFPVYDEQGNLVNIRMYRRIKDGETGPNGKKLVKMMPWQTGYGKIRWYPIEALKEDEVIICEGEPDTLLCRQLGFNAITHTGGATAFDFSWARLFAGKHVWICYDHDEPGRTGTKKAADALATAAAEVRIINLPVTGEKEDFTDWVLRYEGNAEAFRALMKEAPVHRLSEGSFESQTEIPIEEQIRALPPNIDFEERAGAWRRIIENIAKKSPLAQDRLIKMLANRTRISIKLIRQEVQNLEISIKFDDVRPEPLKEPRTVDLSLAQDMCDEVFHFGIWVPTNKETFVFRLVTSDGRLPEPPEGVTADRIPKDFGRWSVDSRTPYNVFAFIDGVEKERNGEPNPAKVDAKQLFDEISAFVRRYMWYSDPRTYDLIAAWIMQTYCFMIFDQVGYLALIGTKRAGKTRLFELLEKLCFNAKLSSSVSDAYMFRSVEVDRTTLLVDEADSLKEQQKEGLNERLELLRGGYRRSGSVGRIEGEDRRRVDFSTYSPKAIANVVGLEDALEDRTLAITVERKPKSVKVERLVHRKINPYAQVLRNKLYCFALQYASELAKVYETVDVPGVEDREAEIWSGIITIATVAKPEIIPDLLNMAKENANRKALHEGTESIEAQIVLAVWRLAKEETPDKVVGAKKWFQLERIRQAIMDQLGWDKFSKKRVATELVKLRIIEDSEDYRGRFWFINNDPYAKRPKDFHSCFWLRMDKILAAAERYEVKLAERTSEETQLNGTDDHNSPF